MEFSDMTEIDVKCMLAVGKSIYVENIEIKPYTLDEILNSRGISNYLDGLNWISLSIDDFINSTIEEENRNYLIENRSMLKTFDFYINLGGQKMFTELIRILSIILRTDDITPLGRDALGIDFRKLGIITEDENGESQFNSDILENLPEHKIKIVNRDNFDEIVNVVKLQNYLKKASDLVEADENPADEETRLLMEHMKKMKEKVENIKKKHSNSEDDSIDISDIISAVSSKSNSINKLNIHNFTLYQIYDEYVRLELIDNYHIGVNAKMAGNEKIEIKHWSGKI